MRRWFVLLLLALLPLQSSWAVAAAYCGHEAGPAVQHLGHHDPHGHAGAVSKADPAGTDSSSPSGAGVDCSHCHGACLSLLAVCAGATLPAASNGHVLAPGAAVRTLALSPPERPQWRRLA